MVDEKFGITARKTLHGSVARGGAAAAKAQAELDAAPPMPVAMEYLWEWHREQRPSGAMGEGVTYEDIEAWARLMDHNPEPHEVRVLLMLDAISRTKPDG